MPFLRSALPVCAARHQLLGRVLVDRQVHPEVRFLERVARLVDRNPGAQQALVDERLDRIDDRRGVGPGREVEHGLGRIEREAALEHRALGERRLLPGQQQVPRPVDRASERRLAIGGAARTGEQGKAVGQPLDQLCRRQHPDARRRQLDRERQAVEQGDDALDGRAVRRREREIGALRAGPQGEQLDALAVERERLERQHVFAGEAKPLAARDQEAGVGRAIDPAADGGLGVLDDLLEVVEDHQAAAARRDRVAELDAGVALAEGHVERKRDDEEHALQRPRVGEVAEVDAARPIAQPAPAIASGQPRLARAAGTEHGQDPRAGVESGGDGRQVRRPADEGVALARQVVAHLAHRSPTVFRPDHAHRLLGVVGRRERRPIAHAQLEDLDRLGDSLQPIVAVGLDRRRVGKGVAERSARRFASAGSGRRAPAT